MMLCEARLDSRTNGYLQRTLSQIALVSLRRSFSIDRSIDASLRTCPTKTILAAKTAEGPASRVSSTYPVELQYKFWSSIDSAKTTP